MHVQSDADADALLKNMVEVALITNLIMMGNWLVNLPRTSAARQRIGNMIADDTARRPMPTRNPAQH